MFACMRKYLFALTALSLLMACTPEENGADNNQSGNGGDKIAHVTGISLDRNSATIKEGEYITLVATVTPSNADNKSVSWSSSSDAVATVDASGKVTGVKAGSATITATAADGGMKASCALSVEANLAPSVTVEAKNVSAISAVLAGKANLGSTVASDLKVGFQYSKSAGILPSNSTTIEATDADASYNYIAAITGLDPETKYYFRSFVRQNGQDTYGETKEFTTKALSSMLHTKEATSVSAVSACLNATLDLTDVRYESKSLGFYWGSSAESVNTKLTSREGSNSISADLLSLTPSKEYYFRAYIVLDGKEYKEEVVSFTTKDIESILGTLDATGIEATKASLNAKLDLSDVKYSSISYGFYWGASESSQNNGLSGGEIKDNAYSAPLTGLSHKTQYWYKAYIKLDSQTFYGEVKTFTTNVVPVESVSLDKTEYTFNTIGNTLTLKATVLPADATDKSVEWSSDKEDVAAVDANGRVTAKGNGKATITVTTKDQGKSATCVITVAQWVTGISLGKTSITLNKGQEQTLIPTVNPSNAADKSLNWTSSNTSVATVNAEGKVTAISKGAATIKAEAKDGSGVFASCAVRVKEPYTAVAGEAVDLGLSVKWSSTNLGATSPTGYGDYFSWGETSPKNNYSWETYELCNGSPSSLTKYNNSSSYGAVDKKSEFKDYGYENDAARQALGGKWRIPTDAEWTELRAKCTWTWKTNYNGSGINGRLVTATNGKSIFLPAAGFRDDTNLYFVGSDGDYWSSSLYTDNPHYAWLVYFNSDYVNWNYYYYRYYGRSVRPVSE